MSFHEAVKNSIFGSISDSNVTSTLVLGGFIFTICQFLITFVQPAPYGRYTNSSPNYLTCMFLIFMPISVWFSPFLVFWFWVTFGDKVTKILRNPCLHFPRQDGQDWKKGKKIVQLKWPKYKKPKDENMGWTKHSFHQGWPKTKWPIVWI